MSAPSDGAAGRPPCTWVLLAGLPGTGKSTLAKALASRLDAVILSKDEVRAALFPARVIEYSDAENEIAVEAILRSAALISSQAHAPAYILIDGRTFSRRSQIDQVIAAAEANRTPWRILHLWCNDELARARILASSSGHPARDRNALLFDQVRSRFEAIERPALRVDTGRELAAIVEEAVAYLTGE